MNEGPREDRFTDGAITFLALWTISANAAVFAGLSLDGLLLVAAGVLTMGAVVAFAQRALPQPARVQRDAARRHSERGLEGRARKRNTRPGPPFWERATCVFVALAVAGFAWNQQLWFFWALSLALSGFIALRELPIAPRFPSPRREPWQGSALIAFSILCVVVTLLAHRPDVDDAYYLNLAVAAADFPEAPLLAHDTLHGVPGVPLTLPVYRVHSIELLAAALSRLTGREVLDFSHILLPAFFAALIPLVIARVMRKLVPTRWLPATGLTLLFLATAADNGPAFANFAFVRLQQGKAAMLMVAIPMVLSYAIEFGRRPSAIRWFRLAAVQIAAVGLSATGLWLAPVVAALGLLTALPWDAWRRLLAGISASAYVLLLGLWLRGETVAQFRDAPVQLPDLLQQSDALVSMALRSVLGWGPLAYLSLFAWLAGWAFAPSSLLRRLHAVFGLAFALLFWNPLWADLVAMNLTSVPTFWRVMWILPLPIWMGILLSTPLAWRNAPRGAAAALCAMFTLLALGLAPVRQALSHDNGVAIHAPYWKVPPYALEAALKVRELSGPGTYVLAPQELAPWIPALSGHPHPLLVRPIYTPILTGHLPADELQRRRELTAWVEGRIRPAHAGSKLQAAVRETPLAAVVIVEAAAQDGALQEALRAVAFEPVLSNAQFQVWASAIRIPKPSVAR